MADYSSGDGPHIADPSLGQRLIDVKHRVEDGPRLKVVLEGHMPWESTYSGAGRSIWSE
jgi:hypothetical protein